MVDALEPLTASPGEGTAPTRQRLYLRLEDQEDPRLRKVRLALSFFPGEDQVVLCFARSKKRLGSRCLIHPALVEDLRQRLGEENVVVK